MVFRLAKLKILFWGVLDQNVSPGIYFVEKCDLGKKYLVSCEGNQLQAFTSPESPSNFLQIMYDQIWSKIIHSQDAAQNRINVQNFLLCRFELFALKIKKH